MTFEAILDQAMAMLQRRGRVTYRTLQRQFQLDDAALDDLKAQLLYAHPQVVDDAGRGLIWTGAIVSVPSAAALSPRLSPRPPLADTPRPHDESLGASHRVVQHAVMRLYEELVSALLQREGRVSYRSLRQLFGFDAACLDHVRQELIFKQLARDAHGEGLAWTGGLPRVVVTDGQPTEPIDAAGASASAPSDAVPALPAAPIRPAPEAERRQLTVLFCDLVGSTQLSGQLDPEDWRAVVRAYQEAAAEVIQPYEGHIAQYLGDGLLVYFGYPTAHEDDARRAVHAGLGIVQAIATLNTRLATQDGVQLAVRLGIHTGPVVVGVMGGGARHGHLALGETPNIAARLQNLAPANAVVISAVTARLVRDTFALEDLGTHTLPGVAEPMTVSRVRGLLTTPSRDEEFVAAGVPLLVGRDEEVGLLRRRWEQSKAGNGQVVLLSGEAGIGKSALVEGLRAQVRAEGLPRIAFRCSPYHTNSALYPVITHIERLLQFEPDDPPATRLAKLEVGLQPYGLPLAEVVPLLAGLLSVPLPAERYAALTLSPQQQKQQRLDALVAWMVGGGRAAAGPCSMGRPALGRPHHAGGTRAGHRAGAHGADVARADVSPGVQPALAPTLPHDSPGAQPAGAPAGRGADHPAGGRQSPPGRGGAVPRGQNGWGAAVYRRADQDAAGLAPAAGRGGPVCAHRAAAHGGHSGHLAGCAHGPARSAQYGQRGGAARGGAGAGVRL